MAMMLQFVVVLLSYIHFAHGATLLGIGGVRGGSSLDLGDATFAIQSSPGPDAVSRLTGAGLSIEMDKLQIKLAQGLLVLSNQLFGFKRGNTQWSTNYFDERIEFRRNNENLLNILASSKQDHYQMRFLGNGYFHDVLLDQAEGNKVLTLLCKADKTITLQRKLDPNACKTEIADSHLSVNQQLEMIGKILTQLSDSQVLEGDRRRELVSKTKTDLSDGLVKELDRRINDLQASQAKIFDERNRTAFATLMKMVQESIAVIDTFERTTMVSIATSQLAQSNNISTLKGIVENFSGRFQLLESQHVESVNTLQNYVKTQLDVFRDDELQVAIANLTDSHRKTQASQFLNLSTQISALVEQTLPSMLAKSSEELDRTIRSELNALNDTSQKQLAHLQETTVVSLQQLHDELGRRTEQSTQLSTSTCQSALNTTADRLQQSITNGLVALNDTWSTSLLNVSRSLDASTATWLFGLQALNTSLEAKVAHNELLLYNITNNILADQHNRSLQFNRSIVAQDMDSRLNALASNWTIILNDLEGNVSRHTAVTASVVNTIAQETRHNITNLTEFLHKQSHDLRTDVEASLASHSAAQSTLLDQQEKLQNESRRIFEEALRQQLKDNVASSEELRQLMQRDMLSLQQTVTQSITDSQLSLQNHTLALSQSLSKTKTNLALAAQTLAEDHSLLQRVVETQNSHTLNIALLQQQSSEVLHAHLQTLSQKVTNFTEAVLPSLQRDLVVVQQENIMLQRQLAEEKDSHKELRREVLTLRDQVSKLEATLKTQEQDAPRTVSLNAQLQQTQSKVSDLQTELAELKRSQKSMQDALLSQVLLLMRTNPRET